MAWLSISNRRSARESPSSISRGASPWAPRRPLSAKRWRTLSAAGGLKLILNLGGVDYIDSTGLGALVMCATTLRRNSGNIKLLNLTRRNIELLVMTKLATVFEIFTDEQDAVNSFYPDRKLKTFDILSFVQEMKKEE